jgi:hypothetical protein
VALLPPVIDAQTAGNGHNGTAKAPPPGETVFSDRLDDVFFHKPEPEPPQPPMPKPPAWAGPPRDVRGAVVATELLLARTDNVAIVLSQALVYRTGCLLTIEVATRKRNLNQDDWYDLFFAVHDEARMPSRRWDRLLRLGLRYPDGTTVTNLDPLITRKPDADPLDPLDPPGPPVGPGLSWYPFSSHGGRFDPHIQGALWLWPLPPAEPLQFAVEWPIAGIDLTIVELDGAELAAAATRSTGYWPD